MSFFSRLIIFLTSTVTVCECVCYNSIVKLFFLFRMPAPTLPTWQDCHELWSKKRRRQLREQQEAMPPGKPTKSDQGD